MSKYGVFSGPYFPAFRLNTERYGVPLRIQSVFYTVPVHCVASDLILTLGHYKELVKLFDLKMVTSKPFFDTWILFLVTIREIKDVNDLVNLRMKTFKAT